MEYIVTYSPVSFTIMYPGNIIRNLIDTHRLIQWPSLVGLLRVVVITRYRNFPNSMYYHVYDRCSFNNNDNIPIYSEFSRVIIIFYHLRMELFSGCSVYHFKIAIYVLESIYVLCKQNRLFYIVHRQQEYSWMLTENMYNGWPIAISNLVQTTFAKAILHIGHYDKLFHA